MLSLKLGDPAKFPFIERPEQRQIADGFQLLKELGAIDDQRQPQKLAGRWRGYLSTRDLRGS